MKFPSFEELAEVIRESARLRRDKRIDPDTEVSRDLEISGKHGPDLLKAIEGHYGLKFASELCDQLENDCLMDREDGEGSPVMEPLLGRRSAERHPVTVGQLYRTVLLELHKLPDIQEQTDGAG